MRRDGQIPLLTKSSPRPARLDNICSVRANKTYTLTPPLAEMTESVDVGGGGGACDKTAGIKVVFGNGGPQSSYCAG